MTQSRVIRPSPPPSLAAQQMSSSRLPTARRRRKRKRKKASNSFSSVEKAGAFSPCLFYCLLLPGFFLFPHSRNLLQLLAQIAQVRQGVRVLDLLHRLIHLHGEMIYARMQGGAELAGTPPCGGVLPSGVSQWG